MSEVEQRTTRDGVPFGGRPAIRTALKPLTDAVHRLGKRLDAVKRAEDARRAERKAHLESLVDQAGHGVHIRAEMGRQPGRTLRQRILGVDRDDD